MHIEHVTINFAPAPGAIAAALLSALASDRAPAFDGASAAADACTPVPPTVIAIGSAWGNVGTYAGQSRGEDGQPDGHLVLLDAVPEASLKWADAVAWAEGLGDGARLPTRFESALLYANLRDKFNTGSWYWTGTQDSDAYAWAQGFYDGYQDYYGKTYEGSARAVRRFPV